MKISINAILARCILFDFRYFLQSIIIDLKDFETNLWKIDKKHYKEINIYYIGYITIKKWLWDDDCESIYSVNPLYLRINHASVYIEEKMETNI